MRHTCDALLGRIRGRARGSVQINSNLSSSLLDETAAAAAAVRLTGALRCAALAFSSCIERVTSAEVVRTWEGTISRCLSSLFSSVAARASTSLLGKVGESGAAPRRATRDNVTLQRN